jgi:phosphopantothenoylcysteine decarboxylase/phosphopantothenate--cysteine ligase
MSATKTILVGVGGGIAAYKTADAVSRLVHAGHDVQVAMTAAARKFVAPDTFSALTRKRVHTTLFPDPESTDGEALFPHIYPACRADAFLVAPATADLIARLAAGFGDDPVCCSALALRPGCLRLFAPAMNEHMWAQPVVQENVRRLEALGWRRIGPVEGALACGTHGPGRMAEAPDLAAAVEAALGDAARFAGRRVLILSGPTREPLDPVRFLGNGGTGRMGRALAEAAVGLGADVDFVTGPVEPERLPSSPRIRLFPVTTAAQMLEAARPLAAGADLLVFAASVADYRPVQPLENKAPKTSKPWKLELEATPDIAAELCRARKPGQKAVGFALESGGGRARAEVKLRAKGFDAIVLNGPGALGAGEADYVCLVRKPRGVETRDWGRLAKAECARRILELF